MKNKPFEIFKRIDFHIGASVEAHPFSQRTATLLADEANRILAERGERVTSNPHQELWHIDPKSNSFHEGLLIGTRPIEVEKPECKHILTWNVGGAGGGS